jgi:cytochrome c biogenesis protein CcdA
VLEGPFALALAAGMAATVNPCGFALLPAYLAAFIGDGDQQGARAVPRAFAVSAAVTLGFVAVFGTFGLIITPLALSVERYLPWATIVIGIGLVGLGISLARGRELNAHIPKLNKGGRDGTLVSMFLYGVSYAIASLSCTIGPFLAVTSTTFRSANLVSGVAVFVAYALGMGIVVTALTVSVALAKASMVGRLRQAMPYVSRGSGYLLIVAGAYVAWYGWFEIRVLNGGDGSDPVVDRALDIQQWLQSRVIPDDPVAAVAVIGGVLALVGAGYWVLRRKRPTTSSEAAELPEPVTQVD